MLKVELKKGNGFRDLTTSAEYYAKNMTAEQRIALLGATTRVQRPGD